MEGREGRPRSRMKVSCLSPPWLSGMGFASLREGRRSLRGMEICKRLGWGAEVGKRLCFVEAVRWGGSFEV